MSRFRNRRNKLMGFSIEWFGGIAGILTTASFLPQVFKTWKTKSTDSLSLPMLLMMTIGIAFWLTYGILINSISMIVSNGITLVSASVLVFFKLKYK